MSSKKNEIVLEILYPAETKLVKLSPERLVGAKAVPAEMPSGLDSSKRSLQRTETLLLPRSEDAMLGWGSQTSKVVQTARSAAFQRSRFNSKSRQSREYGRHMDFIWLYAGRKQREMVQAEK